MKIAIPVSSKLLRTIQDPSMSETRIIHAYPKVSDLVGNNVGEIPLTPDPRKPKDASPVVTKISHSLTSNDGVFHLLNRGITISVFEADYNSKTEILTLDLPEDEDFDKYGVIDGGHTYNTLSNVIGQLRKSLDIDSPLSNQHVHLEVMVKVQENLANIAEARNFSVSLKPWTLAGYRDQFAWFLEAVGPECTKHIKISENDQQPVGILELIQAMSAINPFLFPNGEPALEAYKNAGKCLDYFIATDDKYGFRKMANIAKDILKLNDHIRYTWKKAYNAKDETGKRGALGARTEMHKRQRNRTAMATYYFLTPEDGPVVGLNTEGNEDFPVEKGFYIPALSSMRSLLVEDKNTKMYSWYTDPFEFWDEHGNKVVRQIMAASESVGFNPHVVGRNGPLYTSLYTSVRNDLLEDFFADQGQTLPF